VSPQPGTSPRLSVLLPCFNAARFLAESLQSIQNQTFSDFEVIAVDDGSTDDTLLQLEEWATRDARVRVVPSRHSGLPHALALALEHAAGELIARFDADDTAEPGRFARQVELLDAHADVAACGTGVFYFPPAAVRAGARAYKQWLNSLHRPDEIASDMFVECPLAHPSLTARSDTVRAVGGYQDNGWPEDYDLILRLFEARYRLANVPEVLHNWRESAGRLSRVDARYTPAAFRRCKVHYLKRTLLRGRAVLVWGAGPVGKAFARELDAQNVTIAGFIDVDPRKIGRRIHGIPVHSHKEFDRSAFIVAAVGNAAARTEIRAALNAGGLQELRDYCAVA
jgi:glycosyltransferase involved in cell wall biosynthesis